MTELCCKSGETDGIKVVYQKFGADFLGRMKSLPDATQSYMKYS